MKKTITIIFGVMAVFASLLFFSVTVIKPIIVRSYYTCRHMEEPHTFCWEVTRFLEEYYKKNQKYPPQVDVKQFRLYSIEPFRHYLDTFQYESTGDCFSIIWSYPRDYQGSEARIFKCKGVKGEIEYNWYDSEPNEIPAPFHG